MSTISSRPPGEWDTTQKISTAGPTKYQALVLSDASVYEMARHYYTEDEIAKTFKVSAEFLRHAHGDAFKAGKNDAFTKPRILLARLFEEFNELSAGALVDPKTPTHNLLKAIELHARKYEGYGSTQIIEHRGEKPSATDIRFEPFTKDGNAS